jgi:hypothetical protein
LDLVWKNFLCGLVVRVFGYGCRDPGFDSQHSQIYSLVRTTEELLE